MLAQAQTPSWINRVLQALVYSNLYIAIAAALFTIQTYCQFGSSDWNLSLAGLVFGATLSIYLFLRFVSIFKLKEGKMVDRLFWLEKHRRAGMALLIGGALISIYCFWIQSNQVKLALILPAAISIAYGLPIFGKKGSGRRLRDLGYIKIFLIAFVWAYVTVGLPAVSLGYSLFDAEVMVHFTLRALFIFAITLPFDVKDLKFDKQYGLKTIPTKIGEDKTFRLASLLIIIHALIHLTFLQLIGEFSLYPANGLYAIATADVITLVLLRLAQKNRHEFYFLVGLDGAIIIQSLLVISCGG